MRRAVHLRLQSFTGPRFSDELASDIHRLDPGFARQTESPYSDYLDFIATRREAILTHEYLFVYSHLVSRHSTARNVEEPVLYYNSAPVEEEIAALKRQYEKEVTGWTSTQKKVAMNESVIAHSYIALMNFDL